MAETTWDIHTRLKGTTVSIDLSAALRHPSGVPVMVPAQVQAVIAGTYEMLVIVEVEFAGEHFILDYPMSRIEKSRIKIKAS